MEIYNDYKLAVQEIKDLLKSKQGYEYREWTEKDFLNKVLTQYPRWKFEEFKVESQKKLVNKRLVHLLDYPNWVVDSEKKAMQDSINSIDTGGETGGRGIFPDYHEERQERTIAYLKARRKRTF